MYMLVKDVRDVTINYNLTTKSNKMVNNKPVLSNRLYFFLNKSLTKILINVNLKIWDILLNLALNFVQFFNIFVLIVQF